MRSGFEVASSDPGAVLSDTDINAVVIATRHDTHAQFVVDALNGGKHVFVEKPLCLKLDDLQRIEEAHNHSERLLMVGFNRRFSPQIQKVKRLLENSTGPHSFVMTVNAGSIPSDHWTQDAESGGGRIVGEGCHFVDLLRFLSGAPIVTFDAIEMNSITGDTVSLSLKFADGSIGTVHYFANGNKAFPKERLEVFSGEKVLQLDNFRKLKGYGWPGFKSMNLYRQDKGQQACVAAFVRAIEEGGDSPIPMNEVWEVSRVCIELANRQRIAGE